MRLLKIETLRRALAAVMPLATLAWACPASAEEPVETAVKAWVAAIDVAPEWQAAYTGLTVDPASGKATLTGLAVKSEQPGFSMAFTTITIAGFHATTDGTFSADEIDLDGGDIEVGAFSFRIADAAIAAPVLPETGGFIWDNGDPLVSAIKMLAPLTKATAASARAGPITVVETVQGVQTQTVYNDVKVAGWRNGKIAAMSAGPVKTESPMRTDPPSQPPLVTLSTDASETRDVDLNALLAVYDPASYAGGLGDGVWRQAIGHAAYHHLVIGIPGVTLTVGDAAVNGLRVRQPKALPPPGPQADASSLSVKDQLLRRFEKLALYGMDRFALSNLDLAIPGLVDRAHLDGVTLSDTSTDRVGDLVLTGLSLAVSGGGDPSTSGNLPSVASLIPRPPQLKQHWRRSLSPATSTTAALSRR